jgi:hypothetical protein
MGLATQLEGRDDRESDPPAKKMKMTNGSFMIREEHGQSEREENVPQMKMRMTDSLPKGCEEKVPQIKMRMIDSLPKGCDGSSAKNGETLESKSDENGEITKDENGEAVEEEKREYEMITFNFRKANKWFKAIDLLKVDLTKDPSLKHFHPEGWHPPLPCPPRRQYAPTKEVIGETPKEDETW